MSHKQSPVHLEALEDRFCMSASPLLVAEVAPPEPTEVIVASTPTSQAAGQTGSDLLIFNNGDGSDFLEGGVEKQIEIYSFSWGASNPSAGEGDGSRPVDGGLGFDILTGGDGDDRLDGGFDVDLVRGRDGNDLLIVNNGDGSDFLEGGSGTDTVQVNGADGAGDDFLRETELNDLAFEPDTDGSITLEYIVLG